MNRVSRIVETVLGRDKNHGDGPSLRGCVAALALVLAGAVALGNPGTVEAQLPEGVSAADAATQEEAEVLAAIDILFDGMRARNADMIREAFHPDARLVVAPPEGEEPGAPSISTAQEFIERLGAPGPSIHEPYFEPEVRIDGHLAQVWTYYELYRGEDFSHCGYDAFHLVRTPEGWRIVSIAYTMRTEGCGG